MRPPYLAFPVKYLLLALAASMLCVSAQTLGIHRTNLGWIKNPARELAILDEIKALGARSVRISLNRPFERAVEHVAHCNEIDLPPILMLAIENPAWFPPNRTIRKGNGLLHDMPLLSEIDPERFRAELHRILQPFAERELKIGTLQLFNELNWAGFNGDLPAAEPGIEIDAQTPPGDPVYQQWRKGIANYRQLLAITREVLDDKFGKGTVPLLPAATTRAETEWLTRTGASIVAPALFYKMLAERDGQGISALDSVQGLAVHIYPKTTPPTKAMARTEARKLLRDTMQPILDVVGNAKPFSITEWGYPLKMPGDIKLDKDRLHACEGFLEALDSAGLKPQPVWKQVILYSYDQDPPKDITLAGKPLPSASIVNQWNTKADR